MSSGDLSESFGRQITDWTRRLPEEMQAQSDQILVEAALGGCGFRELQLIMSRIWERYKSSRPDEDGDDPFEDRSVHLNSTMDGAGRVTGQAGQTLTVSSPDGTTVYRSHAPPARPAA